MLQYTRLEKFMNQKKFDWSDSAKAPFIKAAENIIKSSSFKNEIKVDRASFGITKNGEAKVYIQPVVITGNLRKWSQIKKLERFLDETGPIRKRNMPSERMPLHYIGCFVFELETYGFKF